MSIQKSGKVKPGLIFVPDKFQKGKLFLFLTN